MLSEAFYSIRSEWQLMDRLEFDLLFRLFASPKRIVSCGAHRRLTGEIALGALQAGRDLEYSGSSIGIGR